MIQSKGFDYPGVQMSFSTLGLDEGRGLCFMGVW